MKNSLDKEATGASFADFVLYCKLKYKNICIYSNWLDNQWSLLCGCIKFPSFAIINNSQKIIFECWWIGVTCVLIWTSKQNYDSVLNDMHCR